MKTKPKKCCYPDCFNCPYVDCRWDCANPSQYAYIHSEAGKAAQERYNKSEKGKERDKRRAKKRIESGKNAEMCRAYYARNRERIYTAIAVVCGALNANMMCLPSHNMVIDVIGVFALFGAVIFVALFTCATEEEAYEKAIYEYIDKTTMEILRLRVKNKSLEQCLKERKEDESDECK